MTTPKTTAKPTETGDRQLPSQEEIARWVEAGEDLPTLAALFDQLPLARYDILVAQIRKEELLPQHWQVISRRTIPDETVFEELAEVRRLRSRYAEHGLAERRLGALEVGWQELAGKQPSLWTTSDLFVAMRRIIDRQRQVDLHDFLSAVRDVWRDQTLPRGREQLDMLWACLAFVRQKTKK
ncbi:MAG: hypothetical protein V3V82_03150 [Acidimicrobiia bacterium]